MFKKRKLQPNQYNSEIILPDVPDKTTDAANFPNVGVTLSSYKYDAFTAPKATPVSGFRIGKWFIRLPAKKKMKKIAIVLGVLLVLILGWLGAKFIYNSLKIFQGNIFGLLHSTRLDGEDRGRVNILLAGNSADDPGHQGGELTDSLMLVSINTRDNNAFMMSIPRDLWVDIPGYGHAKINEAYTAGKSQKFHQSGYPKGGMGMLEKVVEKNTGLDINYYSLINYNAFKETVNAVGGIDVTIKSPDSRGLYDPNIAVAEGGPLRLTNGKHHLNGKTALNLGRARGDSAYSYGFPQSDFDRTAHQRQMLLALKNKVTSTGVLANPVKLSNLSDALGKNVKTDFNLSEVRRLYEISGKVKSSLIKSVSLNDANGENLLASYTSPTGQSALVPAAGLDDFSDIKHFITRLTSNSPIVKENAKVAVLNATDTYGLAAKNEKKIESKKINVIATGDADSNSVRSKIIDNSKGKKSATLKQLKKLYGSSITKTNPYNNRYEADFIVIVGQDKVTSTSTTNSL